MVLSYDLLRKRPDKCQPPVLEVVFLRCKRENNKVKYTRIIKESSQLYSVWAQEVQYLKQNFHNREYWTGPERRLASGADSEG